MQVSLILWIHTNVCWRCTRKSAPFLNAFINYEPKKKCFLIPRISSPSCSSKHHFSEKWIEPLQDFQSSHISSSSLFWIGPRQAEAALQFFFHRLLVVFFLPINTWRRRLSRRLVISHTAAGVSCLLDKTLLILSCQKLWISQKGTITDTGMHLWCLMEKVTAIIWRCNSLNFEELQVPGCCVSKWILCLKSFSTSTHLFSLISPWL